MQVSESQFTMKAENPGAMDSLIPAMDLYPARSRERFSVTRPTASESHIWLHPGEPVFEAFKQLVIEKLSMQSRRGAIFIDTTTDRPYLFHLAEVSVVRKADPEVAELQREETIISQLVAVKQFDGAEMEICPVEQLLTLKDGQGIPSSAQRLALAAKNEREHACAYIIENVARKQAIEHKQAMISSLPDRENFVLRGFDFQETELAFARVGHSQKARTGNKRAEHALEEIKQQQRLMHTRREDIIRVLRREPELIGPGAVTFIAHALVVPSADPLDIKEQRANVEALAMHIAQAYEEAEGATVIDVHTPALARKANLPPHPGFDLLSTRPGQESRGIEVKGRAATTEVEIYDNEWAKACNMRGRYWLYVVYDCVTPKPRLVRVQDPFGKLLARQFSTAREEERTIRGTVHVGGVRVSACQILEAADK